MRLILIITFIQFIFISVFSQEKQELFKGGMFLHSGYLTNGVDNPGIKGICTGIGGKLTFRTGKHLRFGTEGYVSNFNYTGNEGFYKLGWGGLLGEFQFSNKRLTPVLGVTFGGGKVRDLYPIDGDFSDNAADNLIFKVYSTMIVAPHFSIEFKLTSHINLVAKADYLFYPAIENPSYIARGPRIYLGVLFSR